MDDNRKAYLIPYPIESFAKPIFINTKKTYIGRVNVAGIRIQIDDKHVSRRHACIQFEDGRFLIEDLDSQNGTFLNGQRITNAALDSHDKITIGRLTYLFLRQPDAACDLLPGPSSGASDNTIDISLQDIDFSEVWAQNAEQAARGFLHGHKERLFQSTQLATLAHTRLSLLYQLSESLRTASNEMEVYEKGIDLIMKALPGAKYALVAKRSTSRDAFNILSFTFADQRDVNGDTIPISHTVFEWVLTEKVTLVSENLIEDQRFQESESISMNDLRSIVCAPISGKNHVIGLMYAQANNLVSPFTKEDAKFVSAVANEIALNIDNIRFQKEMLRSERMAAVGLTVSNLAHNLRNLLAFNQTAIQLMDSHIEESDYTNIEQKWQWIKNSLGDIGKWSNDMLDYVKDEDLKRYPVDINALISDSRSVFENSLSGDGVKLEISLTDQNTLWVIDEVRLKQALLNLVINATNAMKDHESPRILISTSISKVGNLLISVTDNGSGIPENNKHKILDLFFTTKGSRGTGLGLPMVQKFVEKYGGRLKFESEEGKGSVFTMLFPKVVN
jgi:signal transduction histidine kinase